LSEKNGRREGDKVKPPPEEGEKNFAIV